MARKKKKQSFFPALIFFALAGAALYYFYFLPLQHKRAAEETHKAAAVSRDILLKKVLIDPALVIYDKGGFVRAKLPLRHDAGSLQSLFKKELAVFPEAAVKLDEKRENGAVITMLSAVINETEVLKAELIKKPGPKIVIILDDWGYNTRDFAYLNSIKQTFNCAVLPDLKHSQKAAELARASKKGVILHLHMQPKAVMPMEKSTIMSGMNENAVASITGKNFKSIGYPRGANNHEGSMATADEKVMSYLMRYFAQNGLFFIDSRTASNSAAIREAKKAGAFSAQRDVFLDNEKNSEYIKGQIEQLAGLAKKKGYAVGIGHDFPATLEVLAELMPKLEARGYEFVYAAEVVN